MLVWTKVQLHVCAVWEKSNKQIRKWPKISRLGFTGLTSFQPSLVLPSFHAVIDSFHLHSLPYSFFVLRAFVFSHHLVSLYCSSDISFHSEVLIDSWYIFCLTVLWNEQLFPPETEGEKACLALRSGCEDVGWEAKCMTDLNKTGKLLSAFLTHLINWFYITHLEAHHTSSLPLPATF